jgi:hypothetical protein
MRTVITAIADMDDIQNDERDKILKLMEEVRDGFTNLTKTLTYETDEANESAITRNQLQYDTALSILMLTWLTHLIETIHTKYAEVDKVMIDT